MYAEAAPSIDQTIMGCLKLMLFEHKLDYVYRLGIVEFNKVYFIFADDIVQHAHFIPNTQRDSLFN
jgi:hypothetical protein